MHRYRSILVTWETSFWPITLYDSDCYPLCAPFLENLFCKPWESCGPRTSHLWRWTCTGSLQTRQRRLRRAGRWFGNCVCVDIQMHVVCLLPPSPIVEWQLPLHSAVGTSLILLVLTSVCMLGVFKIVLPQCWSKINRCLVHGSACGNWAAPEQQLLCIFDLVRSISEGATSAAHVTQHCCASVVVQRQALRQGDFCSYKDYVCWTCCLVCRCRRTVRLGARGRNVIFIIKFCQNPST